MRFPSTARISAGSARHPWRTLGVWLALLVAGAMFAGMFLSDALTTDIQLLDNPESIQGENLLADRMGYETPLTETIIVSSDSLTVDAPEFKQVVDNVFVQLGSLTDLVDQDPSKTVNYYLVAQAPDAEVAAQAEQLVSEDRSTLLIPVTLLGEADEAQDAAETVSRRDRRAGNRRGFRRERRRYDHQRDLQHHFGRGSPAG